MKNEKSDRNDENDENGDMRNYLLLVHTINIHAAMTADAWLVHFGVWKKARSVRVLVFQKIPHFSTQLEKPLLLVTVGLRAIHFRLCSGSR